MIEFASEASIPTAKWPPDPVKNLAATALQTLIIRQFVERGYGEGIKRLHRRLRDTFGDLIHPGLEVGKTPNDPTSFRRNLDGKPLLRETVTYDNELRFQVNGLAYQIPRRPTYEVVVDPQTQQPISFQRREPRFFPNQQFKLRHNGWKARLLCPTVAQIQHFFQLDPNIQLDRQTRHQVAGGVRAPLKNSIMPHLPPSILHTVYIDTLRMPVTEHAECSEGVPPERGEATTLLRNSLEGGVVATRMTATTTGGTTYRWLFLAVDGFSKFCYVAPINQRGVQRGGTTTWQSHSEASDDDPTKPENRPQSEQTFNEFMEFLGKANKLRQDHGLADIRPSVVVHDNGSEFKGAFAGGMRALREQHEGLYKEKTTPNGRSQYNSPAERQVKTIRRYFFAIRNAFERSVAAAEGSADDGGRLATTAAAAQQKRLKERGSAYDWVLDVPEVLRRYNTAHHTTIKCKPLEALLEIVLPATVKDRIHGAAKKRFEGVRHEVHLPGFSPSSPPEIGDFVRLKTYKTGELNANFPRLDGLKANTKTASHNWSSDIYRVVAVRTVNYGLADAKEKQERLQNHVDESEDGGSHLLDKAQRTLLKNPVQGARLYQIENVNPQKRNQPREGQKIKYYNRVEILKIPRETVVDGLALDQLQEKYEREYDAQRAETAAATAMRALRAQQQQQQQTAVAGRSSGIPLEQRSAEEDLGDFSHSLAQLQQRSPARRYVYRNAAVLELKREFIVGYINEVKPTPAYSQSIEALDNLADKFDDDFGIEELEGDALASAWSVYASVRVERRVGEYVLTLRFPNLTTNDFVDLEFNVSQFADGGGIDDNPFVRAVKRSDGTTTDDYAALRRGPGSYLLDNVPSSFTRSQVRALNRRRS